MTSLTRSISEASLKIYEPKPTKCYDVQRRTLENPQILISKSWATVPFLLFLFSKNSNLPITIDVLMTEGHT